MDLGLRTPISPSSSTPVMAAIPSRHSYSHSLPVVHPSQQYLPELKPVRPIDEQEAQRISDAIDEELKVCASRSAGPAGNDTPCLLGRARAAEETKGD